jgi:hypothetical protein
MEYGTGFVTHRNQPGIVALEFPVVPRHDPSGKKVFVGTLFASRSGLS